MTFKSKDSYDKNIYIIYHNEAKFYHARTITVKYGTYTARFILNHKWHVEDLKNYYQDSISISITTYVLVLNPVK